MNIEKDEEETNPNPKKLKIKIKSKPKNEIVISEKLQPTCQILFKTILTF